MRAVSLGRKGGARGFGMVAESSFHQHGPHHEPTRQQWLRWFEVGEALLNRVEEA